MPYLALVVSLLAQPDAEGGPVVVLRGTTETERAPHGEGNVYAPEIRIENGVYRMWYGGQGRDGHDRIHYAESRDGTKWKRRGAVLEDKEANHVNDPSVVKKGEAYFLYYTVAGSGVTDRIDVATSWDGIRWERMGVALRPGSAGEWDALLVGRPSVLVEDGVFKMWYDGRKDLPTNAPDPDAPKSATSRRSVGFATSRDGWTWEKHAANPVFGEDAGAVHVSRRGSGYLMLYESRQGTRLAESRSGTEWESRGLLVRRSGDKVDRHGHVTPFLLTTDGGKQLRLFVGAARATSWDRNSIARWQVDPKRLDQLLRVPPASED